MADITPCPVRSITIRRPLSTKKLLPKVNQVYRQRKASRLARSTRCEEEDGAELARSSCSLPSDRRRNRPQSQRQNTIHPLAQVHYASDVVECDADLYRLGLLYDDDDDEHLRGPGFGLDTIFRADPVFAVRPTKSSRHNGKKDTAWDRDNDDYSMMGTSRGTLGHDDSAARPLESDMSSAAHTESSTSAGDAADAATSAEVPDLMPDLEGEGDGDELWAMVPRMNRVDSDIGAVASTADGWVVLEET